MMGKEQKPIEQSGSESEVKAQPEPVERGVSSRLPSDDVLAELAKEFGKEMCKHRKYDGISPELDKSIDESCQQVQFMFALTWMKKRGY
jgi:hypothetical protein